MAAVTTVSEHAVEHRPSEANPPRTSDLLFDAVYGGAVGGAAIALFFLVADLIQGRPLFTPSLLGSVLFTDTAASATVDVRVDMVALYSIVHFVVFGLCGAIVSLLHQRFPPLGRRIGVTSAIVFAMLTVAIVAGDFLLMPGVIGAIGLWEVLVANVITGVAMASFLRWSDGYSKTV